MKKKLYVFALALMLAVSMNAFAGPETKGCAKADAKYCEIKDAACCKNPETCDKSKCDKKSEKQARKQAQKSDARKAS